MTDDLIARLRSDRLEDVASQSECADALEAQARRIAELTGNREAWKGIQEGTARLLQEKEARIAELEAALKIYAEARCSGMICAFDDGEAARAALEKKC